MMTSLQIVTRWELCPRYRAGVTWVKPKKFRAKHQSGGFQKADAPKQTRTQAHPPPKKKRSLTVLDSLNLGIQIRMISVQFSVSAGRWGVHWCAHYHVEGSVAAFVDPSNVFVAVDVPRRTRDAILHREQIPHRVKILKRQPLRMQDVKSAQLCPWHGWCPASASQCCEWQSAWHDGCRQPGICHDCVGFFEQLDDRL